ncbi:MAG: glycosyltransferase [Bacteroidota bacterium]
MIPDGKSPLVSILVWSDHCAELLAATLDSLLLQTYPTSEILVIDNASGDASPAILAAYAAAYPGKVDYIRLEQPMQRTAAEHGQRHRLRGEFVAFASAGSRSAPNRIASSIEHLLTAPNLGAVCSRISGEDERGKPVESRYQQRINEGDVILRRRLPREGNIIDPDSVTLRRRFLDSQPFNPAFAHCGHLPLWLHILDDSELLRDNDVWVKHQRSASATEAAPSLAEAYETVACIAAAFRRWRLDQYFRFATREGTPERRIEEAAGQAQLAQQLVELDRKFFGRPAIGCHEAYFHALAAVAGAPLCLEAQEALQLVERCLGDGCRAAGGPSRPLSDWQAAPAAEIPDLTNSRTSPTTTRYRRWQEKHALQEIDGAYFAEHMVRLWQQRPAFVVLELPGPRTTLAERLADQLYPAAFARTAIASESLGASLQGIPPGKMAGSNWLFLLPHGARPEPAALLQLGEAINRKPEALAWYADDELMTADRPAPLPRFKPDTDPLLLTGSNYLGALAIRLDAALVQSGSPLDAATPYALALELLAQRGRASLGHIAEILVSLEEFEVPAEAESRALQQHLAAYRPDRELLPGPFPGTRWLGYPAPTASIGLVVIQPPGQRFDPAGLEALLASTVGASEILVCAEGSQTLPASVRALPIQPGDNLATVGNRAAQLVTSDYLLFIGSSNRPRRADWLVQAAGLAADGDYAAVGVAGLDPESGNYWGAGTVIGIGGGFDSLHGSTLGPRQRGHLDRAAVAHEISAIAADGLLTRRDAFVAAGGFDAQWQMPEVIATDYCLRLGQAGQRIAWTPQAVVERRQPGMAWPEPPIETQMALRDRFIARWLPQLAADPCWNRHLSLLTPTAEPEDDLVFRWNPDYRDRLRILALPMPASGQAEYRVTAPLRALDNAGLAQTLLACEPLPDRERAPIPSELARLAPDTLYLQAAFDDVRFHGLRSAAHFNPDIFRIFSLDDRISDMPAYNASSKALPRDVVMRRMSEALRCCNRLVVSTEPLREVYRHEIDDIVVVPNRLEKARWCGLHPEPVDGPRPRVGWAGALQHAGDLAMIREVVETLAGEVDWVFFGMIPAGCEPFIKEFHGTVHLDAYPAKLASLNLDLAVAPLEINLFNESKSNLRLLEYGIFGWPVICTDIDPYRTNAAPVCRLPNQARRWIAAIREHLADRDALRARGQELQSWVHRHYLLEDHLDDWLKALSPR